ncbi:MAG: HSP90 family protein [Propionibacteriaceae bacterium]|jgi:molecular chaperone HtpG|nr:HSP90 family protein [Propionibacteriaceae bacterium]
MEERGSAFRVDLRGVVDLLARHLYSGPNVYVRELLQNGVDAITARQQIDPGAPGSIRIRAWQDNGLEIVDTGVGLTTEEAREFLATVGRSAKRDIDLNVGRAEFLGQFGIGLLSAFMVADSIELVARSARDLSAPTVTWTGHDDGRYDLTEAPRDPADPPGSIVRILPRRGMEHWLAVETVVALASEFGQFLPVDIEIEVPLNNGEMAWRRVSEEDLPWAKEYPHTLARREGLAQFCEKTMGFTPMATIDLSVPIAGLTGVAFVLPHTTPPGSGGYHRVYLKKMLLGSRVTGLVPEWAFFVRCAVDATGLAPTASREQLYADDTLLATQEALAATIRQWVVDTLTDQSTGQKEFVHTHHLALRSLALTDDIVLDLSAEVLPFETTDGIHTLREVMDQADEVVYTSSLEEYRRVAPVARAQGLLVVNAGYVYDSDFLAKLAERPGWTIRALTTADISQVLAFVEPSRELETLSNLSIAADILDEMEIDPVLRRFEPEGLPAMILDDSDTSFQREAAEAMEEADDVWSEVLAELTDTSESRRKLVFNDANRTVRRLMELDPSGPFFKAGVQTMYVSAVLVSGEPLRPPEAALMNDSLETFLSLGLGGDAAGPEDGPDAKGFGDGSIHP